MVSWRTEGGPNVKSETNDVQQIFQDRRQYRVPFYQRAYVWSKEEQWEPLWNDIREKAEARMNGQPPAPHFLGAIVLEPQERRGLRGVETYHIIDGQQRLTTLQYFLVALAMAIREDVKSAILTLIEGCLWNPNPDTMEQPEIERFKVWPTFRDREDYREAMEASDRDELRSRFPASFTQGGSLRRIGLDHPPALEAIWFFRDQIAAWLASEGDSGHGGAWLEGLAEAALRDLKIVAISLEKDDDAQVIFETLNGRGAELHATDLIRNFIFMRADREGADGASLYDTLWTPFEGSFWTEGQRRGRLIRPRLEWFVQTALQAELADNVEIGRLYTDYRRYGLGQKTPVKAESQLRMLTKHADQYQQLMRGAGGDPIARFGKRMAEWDASPTHALALRVASSDLSPGEQTEIFNDIVSFIVRRAMCGLTIKNYNNVFLQLLKHTSADGLTAAAIHAALSESDRAASRWPGDDEFRRAWLLDPAHERFGDVGKIRMVLGELENALRSVRSEEPFIPVVGTLDVDHILPDKWYAHWQLNGEAITTQDASNAFLATIGMDKPDPRVEAINRREKLKATMGNLTLVHYGINRSLQNGPFAEKRERLFAESNLHLNRALMRAESWDEATIEKRGNDLFDVARAIWRSPTK
jgi:hypothetical protein